MFRFKNHFSARNLRYTSSLSTLKKICSTKINEFREAGLLKTDKLVVVGVDGSNLRIKGFGKTILNFGSSDCFGLSVGLAYYEASESHI